MYVLDFGVSYRHEVLILGYICPELLSSIAYSSARVVILQVNVDLLWTRPHDAQQYLPCLHSHPYDSFSWERLWLSKLLSMHACIGACVLASP